MKNILYCKYTNNRSEKFKIKTLVYEEDGIKKVEKHCLSDEGKAHVDNIYKNYKRLQENNKFLDVCINKAIYHKNYIEFEYINGDTLTEVLNKYVKEKKYEDFIKKIEDYRRIIGLGQEVIEFEYTDKFEEVFGKVKLDNSLMSICNNNIDLNFDNIIINDKINIYDYEWVFDFPIPIEFTLYRAIKYYIIQLDKQGISIDINLWEYININENNKILFEEMECNFYNYVNKQYINIHDLSDLWGFNKTNYSLNELLYCVDKVSQQESYQVFYDYGNDFNEDDSYKNIYTESADKYITIRIPLNGKEKRVRIDPANQDCIINLNYICVYDRGHTYQPEYVTNANYEKDNIMLFATDDAQIIFKNINYQYASYIEMQFQIGYLTKGLIYKLTNKLSDKTILKGLLVEMENKYEEEKKLWKQELEKYINNEVILMKEIDDYIIHKNLLCEKLEQRVINEKNLFQQVQKLKSESIQLQEEIGNNIKKLKESELVINKQNELINSIYNTKAWKMAERLRKIRKIFEK